MRSKRTYYSDTIAECVNIPKCLFKITKNLMGHNGDFFTRKITTIRDNIGNNKSLISDAVMMGADIKFEGRPLTKLAPATHVEVRDIFIKSPSKSFELYPFELYLLKEVLEYLLPLITNVINKSLMESKVPLSFKKANIRPLLKKPNLNKE